MSKLFSDKETFQKERPSKLTERQRNEFYLIMADEVIKNNWSEDDREDIAKDLSSLTFYGNGYDMAKELEGHSSFADYNIDPSFCEWLDFLEHNYRIKIDENIKEWVKAHDVKPKYQIGDQLIIINDFTRSLKINDKVYITGIYIDVARYVLHEDKYYKGGILLPFENVEENCKLNN